MHGKIYQVNIKSQVPGERGLPKYPVPWAKLTKQGVLGLGKEPDFNKYRFEQKDVPPDDRAVLVYPLETIVQLNNEGWPALQPGHIGENLTTEGILYEQFAAGQYWQAGDAIILLTVPATPCGVLAQLPYVGVGKKAAFKQALEGRRGWYAAVEKEGIVVEGSTFALLSRKSSE
jgi:MOSC domain-containing protein YiiM